jgi:hypothetical protein
MKNKVFGIISLFLLLVFVASNLHQGLVFAQTSNPPSLESEITVDSGNGFGSTGIYARRFLNVDVNVGSDITLTQSATDGDSFTINTNGIYSISLTDLVTSGDSTSISLNSSGATQINSLTAANRLCSVALPVGVLSGCSVTLGLSSGDVIRVHRSIGANCSCTESAYTSFVRFIITKVR